MDNKLRASKPLTYFSSAGAVVVLIQLYIIYSNHLSYFLTVLQ